MTSPRDILKPVLVPIHSAGYPFIAGFAGATLLLGLLWSPLLIPGGLLTAWCIYFFRDPPRVTPQRAGLVISPADGIVLPHVQAAPPPELGLGETTRTRISIFMNVFDVHVNRNPVSGRLRHLAYHKGRFLNASLDKASVHNERNALCIELPDRRDIVVVQIAGLVARRILCDLREGHSLNQGERFGMIRFGSRLDVYLPEGVAPLVSPGQRMIAGESVLADLMPESYSQEAREGRSGEST